jgi:hypothetical protein
MVVQSGRFKTQLTQTEPAEFAWPSNSQFGWGSRAGTTAIQLVNRGQGEPGEAAARRPDTLL